MLEDGNSFFNSKKTAIQFVMSLFVFFIHFSAFSVFQTDEFVNNIFQLLLTLTHVAVPLFFVISGALFYRNYTFSLTIRKWKSRFFLLCIPYLVWNTLWLILAFLGYYTPLGAVLGGVKASFSWETVFSGILLHGYFEPFWFVYQLIVLTLCCPIIYLLLKHKWFVLISMACFYIMYCFGFNFNPVFLPNTGLVLLYLIGAWIGIHYLEVFTTRKGKKTVVISLVIYVLCCVFDGVAHLLPAWCHTLQIPLIVTIISCAAFWISFDYFETKKTPGFMTHSFLIYAMHSFIGAALCKIFSILLSNVQGGLVITAIIAFPATIVIICIFGDLTDRFFPKIKRILTGR